MAFDDEAVADYFDTQVDLGRKPEQFGRIWLHTHPGDSPSPSGTDEATFRRVFGSCDWAVMCILAKGGRSFARLRFNIGPGGHAAIPVEVDYSRPFGATDRESWEIEYRANIDARAEFGLVAVDSLEDEFFGYTCPDDWLEDLEAMEPAERRLVLDELSVRPDLWGESEVFDELD